MANMDTTEAKTVAKAESGDKERLIESILSEIASSASCIESLSYNVINDLSDEQSSAAEFSAANAKLAQQIGFLADRCSEAITGASHFKGGADEWFLSPALSA